MNLVMMDLANNDSTSIITIDRKTLTMPLRTAMGMLVNSCDALNPKRIGIRVIKKPKAVHLNMRITISEKVADCNRTSA